MLNNNFVGKWSLCLFLCNIVTVWEEMTQSVAFIKAIFCLKLLFLLREMDFEELSLPTTLSNIYYGCYTVFVSYRIVV